jgi:hypothetical protein
MLRHMPKKRRGNRGRRPPGDHVETLERVAELIGRERWVEARHALEPALERHPDSLDVLAARG